jgi:hypothetical protein
MLQKQREQQQQGQPQVPNSQPQVPNSQPQVPNLQPQVPNSQPQVPNLQPQVQPRPGITPPVSQSATTKGEQGKVPPQKPYRPQGAAAPTTLHSAQYVAQTPTTQPKPAAKPQQAAPSHPGGVKHAAPGPTHSTAPSIGQIVSGGMLPQQLQPQQQQLRSKSQQAVVQQDVKRLKIQPPLNPAPVPASATSSAETGITSVAGINVGKVAQQGGTAPDKQNTTPKQIPFHPNQVGSTDAMPRLGVGPSVGAHPIPAPKKRSTDGPAQGQLTSQPTLKKSKQPTGVKSPGLKVQEDHTLINSFSIEQIEKHVASLNSGLHIPLVKLKAKAGEVLKTLQSHQHAWVFNSPVDPVELALPDYFQIIKRPMDLGTIKKRLENGCYHSIDDFKVDSVLTFDNAMLYNQEGSVVHNMAKEMKAVFMVEWEKMMKVLHQEEDEKRKNGEACSLCGCEKLLFEPPVFYCNGLNCPNPGKRIRRNSYFYVSANQQYHWCHQCWGELSEKPIEMADVTVKKHDLTKKKNDEVHEESWVQCDTCERWIHQICALFNTRQNKDQRSEYICPTCTVEKRRARGEEKGVSRTPMAEDLPRTNLSEWLEGNVRSKMAKTFDALAREKSKQEVCACSVLQ